MLISVDNRQVEYLLAGEGPPVVFSSPSWWPLDAWRLSGLPHLADRYRVLAFNHRGIGQSQATPDPYTLDSLSDDLLALLRALGISGVHVVGFAIGGPIALAAAKKAPQAIASLVVAAAGSGSPRREPPVVPPGITAHIQQAGYLQYIREHALDDFAFSPAFAHAHPEVPRALADALTANAGSEAEFLKHVLARQGYDVLADLDRVTQPILVMVGGDDLVARGESTPVATAHALAEHLPNARLEIIPGVRHMLFWEQPDACWRLVRQFLAEAAGGSAT
jgi:pimeloyl-ACP methyl ester carboxylesterase